MLIIPHSQSRLQGEASLIWGVVTATTGTCSCILPVFIPRGNISGTGSGRGLGVPDLQVSEVYLPVADHHQSLRQCVLEECLGPVCEHCRHGRLTIMMIIGIQ